MAPLVNTVPAFSEDTFVTKKMLRVEKNGNDSFMAEEDTPFSPDPSDTDFEKSTPILSRQNTEIITLSNITPNGSKSQLESSNGDLKRVPRRSISSIPASPSHLGMKMGTPVISPVRSEKRRVLEDGDEVAIPMKRQKTVDYSEWKRDYEGPVEEPHPDLVSKVIGFTEYKRTGANINREYRRKKEFKNPDILEKLVKYYNIIEIGSNYPASKFDPFKWKASSFYDALAEEQQRMYEKQETDKKASKSKSSKSGNKAVSKHKSSTHSSKDTKEKERDRGERDRRQNKKETKQQNKTKWDIGAEKDDTRRFNS